MKYSLCYEVLKVEHYSGSYGMTTCSVTLHMCANIMCNTAENYNLQQLDTYMNQEIYQTAKSNSELYYLWHLIAVVFYCSVTCDRGSILISIIS